MRFRRLCTFLTIVVAGVLCAVVRAEEAAPAGSSDEVARVAAQIDQLIAIGWDENRIEPAPEADDAEFVRRAYLDVTGRIPPASAVRDFLADESPGKRRDLVDRLLGSATYIVHYTNLWRAAMIPEADADQQIRFFLPGFEAWLRSRIAENRNYAQIVDEVLTLPFDAAQLQQFQQGDAPSPAAFYRAKEAQPENLAASTARIFLGLRLECAQCHDHFFDKWKQDEFWSYAAFFTSISRNQMMRAPDGDEGNAPVAEGGRGSLAAPVVLIPGTERTVVARFLDGSEPSWAGGADSRQVLANWVTSPQNAYFARAAVNRIWANHFGIGLVDPVDDLSTSNPPSHPDVLDLLASEFATHDFDVKFVIRVVMATRAYRLTSRLTHESQQTPRTFARMAVRGLTPEQIFDSIAQATGYQQPFNPEEPLNFNNDPRRQEFLENFANSSDTPTEQQSTILQALSLINGEFVADATNLSESRTLAAVAQSPFLSAHDKVEALFLATLSRLPTADESDRFTAYIASGGSTDDAAAALGDIFWALLNCSEFLMNH
ncbi:MAG: DUF1553 domain-containing protein [Planctomycetaceae bacterium]|nr:DUF1553 domain-containing protein [Planctomycetaceae bacterium]